ncbi:PABIR family member 1 isoform X4 [Rattus norvegicus]|uniref:PABIR family member 3 isoform 3 n=1 Tax=Rattus norvegicus TaxID=10116 RepID=UPI00191725B2|nr:PABIR family member 1 isoform X3 [Rattus norvegicus]
MSLNEQEPDTIQNFQLGRGFILNTDVTQETMEVDLGLVPASSTVENIHLRRSTSIPLVNGFGDNSQGLLLNPTRMRRNSSPFANQHSLEEGMDIAIREAMHERDMHTAMQISQSWEECLNLNDDNNTMTSSTKRNTNLNPVSPAASLAKKPGKNSHDRQTF